MRFLVCQPGADWAVQDVYAGWVEALRGAGQQVFEYNLSDRLIFYSNALFDAGGGLFRPALSPQQATELATNGLYAALMRVRPHVLLSVSAFFLPLELFDIARAAGVRVVVVHTEAPYEDDRQTATAAHADLNLVNDPTNLERYRALAPAEYFPQAYRPSIHHPGPAVPDLVCDLAFIGSGWPSRVAFFEAMNLDGLDVRLSGHWQGLSIDSPLAPFVDDSMGVANEDTADVYRSARCGLNLYRAEAQRPELSPGWAMGPREVEMAACGAFFLRAPRGEGDEVLDMLPVFTGPADAGERLRWWLARPDHQRAAAAEKARAAITDRTFDNHARRLLRLLDKE